MTDNIHTKTKRIARNTVLLYMRSLISLFISLYTSRLVLKGLGVNDYGIYGVVGSFVSMFSIVTSSLNGAISRFLNYAMGKGDKENLANTFALSLNIMVILSIIVVLLTETFGLWFFYNRMNITPGRETAAFWCFQFSVLSSVSSFLVVSFSSSIIAHEKMGVFAYIDTGEVILKFFIALLLTFSIGDVDKLILYAALLLVIKLIKQTISRIYATRHFKECRIRWYWDRQKFLEMFRYAGWNFLGNTSGTFSGQGVNMVINVVFGPAVNAARSLSWTVINSVAIFVNNFTLAFTPQITQSYASGDHNYMYSLLYRGTKFTYYIMWVIALPLILETQFVLTLWLGDYPDHTINFIRLALFYHLIGTLQVILAMGIRATGKIQWMQLSFSFLEFSLFIAVYFLLHNGFSPEWSYICPIFMAIIKVLIMWKLSKLQLGIPIKNLLKTIILPTSVVTLVSSFLPVLVWLSLPYGLARFLIVLAISLISTSSSILFIGCTKTERKMLLGIVWKKLKKSNG